MRQVNVLEVVDSAKLNRFHYLLLFWCSFIMLFDGYDLVIYGSVLPQLMTEWNLTPSQAGVLGASSMAGMMFGAFTLGMLADHLGRRNIILFCVGLFSLAALANGFASNPTEFTLCRFLTGAGLGGVVPNLVTILKEMSPGAYRNRLINFMLSFFAIGGLASGLVGIYVIPHLGWQAPFYIGGLSCLALPLLYKMLPESVTFLVHKNRQDAVATLLRQINPQHRPTEPVVYGLDFGSTGAKPGLQALLGGQQAISTLMLWLGFGMVMLMVYGLNTWLPKLMHSGGYPLSSSIGFLVIMNLGALAGQLTSGWMADRWGSKLTLVVCFVIAALSIALLGIKPNTFSLYALLLLAGGSTVGCMSVIHALAADIYPAHVRSTGVSLAAAIGRCGAISGPLLGGFLFSLNLPFEQNFLVFAVPAVIAVIAVLLIGQPRTLPIVQPQPSEGI